MSRMLEQVRGGWMAMTEDGKFLVLLLGCLLYLWGKKAAKENATGWKNLSGKMMSRENLLGKILTGENLPGEMLLRYSTVTLLLILFPPTAMLLGWYQTKFYDFVWLFSLVPMTLMIAYGAAEVLTECYKKYCRKRLWKTAGLAAMSLAVLLLCGNLDTQRQWLRWDAVPWDGESMTEEEKMMETLGVLDYLEKKGDTENACLWAPALVMDYVRRVDDSVRLFYGRNMWDAALNAYSYDSYPEALQEAYTWMEESASFLQNRGGRAQTGKPLAESVKAALDQGVNYIVLPWEKGESDGGICEALTEAIQKLGHQVTVEKDWGYYFFRIDPGEA